MTPGPTTPSIALTSLPPAPAACCNSPSPTLRFTGIWTTSVSGGASGTPSPTATATATATGSPVAGGALWYNGDFDGVNGLANENNTSLGAGNFASVYDDFNVTGTGWQVTE